MRLSFASAAGSGMRRACRTLAALVLTACALATRADPLPLSDGDDGISCAYFDVLLGVAWPTGKPEGVDADGRLNGPHAFATDRLTAADTRRVRRLDLTALVRAWWGGRFDNDGLLLRVSGGDMLIFHAREAADPTLRPQLLLHGADGRRRFLEPVADATLDCTTYRGLGRQDTLIARGNTWVALRFDLAAGRAADAQPPQSAELLLIRTPQSHPVQAVLDVLALRRPTGVAGAPRLDGIAQRHKGDQGIDKEPDVLFADGFEGRGIDARWTQGMAATTGLVSDDKALDFQPLSGQALKLTIPKGKQVGLDLRYRFRQRHGNEPDEIYFRYYLRLARDWLLASDGGKLPGLAGTYGHAGWGGRAWDGNKGWSLRGSYAKSPPQTHAARGRVMLGTYAYHSKAGSEYGEVLPWMGGGLAGLAEPDRWYCIEQHLRLNTPGKSDGLFEVWIDGQLALARQNLRLRDREGIHIEEIWMNVFHGGTDPAPAAMHAFIDNVVVARRYIGLISR